MVVSPVISATLETDAFGSTLAATGAGTPFGFAGQHGYQSDANSGLMRLGHRYYDPSVGRFLSRDPIQDGYNWYAYCDNDPVNTIDPSGLSNDNPGDVTNKSKNVQYVLVGTDPHDGITVRPWKPGDPKGPGGVVPPKVVIPSGGGKPRPLWPVDKNFGIVPVEPGQTVGGKGDLDTDAGWNGKQWIKTGGPGIPKVPRQITQVGKYVPGIIGPIVQGTDDIFTGHGSWDSNGQFTGAPPSGKWPYKVLSPSHYGL